MILDVVIETGNPADSERLLPMLERHIAFYRRRRDKRPPMAVLPPVTISAKPRLAASATWRSTRRPACEFEDMVKSRWIYRKLRNFRAGIEAGISWIKRSYGLARCTWRGLDHFKAYIWSSVVAFNLALFARLKPI